MPLIDLLTDLKTLKFGKDRPGGGDSGLPYIKTPLPENATSIEKAAIDAGKFSIDFPIRGGALAAVDSITDTLRIGKFYVDPQRGPFFITKQVGLQASNPRTETGQGLGPLRNTQLYNLGLNTLAQVGTVAIGNHFDRPGIKPVMGPEEKYAYVVGIQNIQNESKTNRLLTLYNLKVSRTPIKPEPEFAKSLGIDVEQPLNLFNYPAGPGSLYGLGTTVIRRYDFTTPPLQYLELFKSNSRKKTQLSNLNLDYRNFISASAKYYNELRLTNPQASISGSLTISQQTTGSIIRNNFTTTPYPTNFSSSFPNGSAGRIIEPTNYLNYLGASEAYIKKVNPNVITEQKLGINANGQSVTLGQQATGSITFNNFTTTPYPTNFNDFDRPVVSQSITPTNINPRGFNLTSDSTDILETVIEKSNLLETNDQNLLQNANDPSFSSPFGYTLTYKLIRDRADESRKNKQSSAVQDFRKTAIDNNIGKTSLYAYDYNSSTVNIEQRVGIGNPGRRSFNRTSIGNTDPLTQDKINMSPIVSNTTAPDFGSNRDLIKFCFEGASNNTAGKSTKIFFRAFLDSFSDAHNANWQGFQYTGRGDTFYTYQGFTRQVSLGFKVAAQTAPEMKFIWGKVNYLASLCYPDYNTAGLMRGNITILTVGDYLYRVPGILNNVNITVPQESPWEIAMNEPENVRADKDQYELPHMCEINISFTPILNVLARRGPSVPLITPADKGNKFLKDYASILE